MPVAAHRRLSFRGIFGTVNAPFEEWSFRLNLAESGADEDGTLLLDAAVTAFTTHVAPRIKGTARLQEIKYARISAGNVNGAGPGGAYVSDPTIRAVDIAGSGAGGEVWPAQIALAVSLETATRGPRGRGRIYLPTPAVAISTVDGVMSAADAQTVASAMGSFITALNGPAGFGNVAIVSTFGTVSQVNGVRVGRALDTIRSRRRSLPEAYTAEVAVP